MKFYKYSLLLLSVLFFWSCERDDICAEGSPTTPRLLIDFFDVADVDMPKTVSRFSVYAELLITNAGVITLPETEEEVQNSALIFNSNSNTIALPLLIDDGDTDTETTIVRYYFERNTNLRLDDNAATDSDIDILQITYKPEDIYVSRACGFKSIFNDF